MVQIIAVAVALNGETVDPQGLRAFSEKLGLLAAEVFTGQKPVVGSMQMLGEMIRPLVEQDWAIMEAMQLTPKFRAVLAAFKKRDLGNAVLPYQELSDLLGSKYSPSSQDHTLLNKLFRDSNLPYRMRMKYGPQDFSKSSWAFYAELIPEITGRRGFQVQ